MYKYFSLLIVIFIISCAEEKLNNYSQNEINNVGLSTRRDLALKKEQPKKIASVMARNDYMFSDLWVRYKKQENKRNRLSSFKKDSLKGEIIFRLEFRKEGKLSNISIVSNTIKNSNFVINLQELVSKLSFKEIKGENYYVEYPIDFLPLRHYKESTEPLY